MSEIVMLNKHQKKALVIELYKQGKTRRQIAETVHMSFKDIANIINEYTGENKQVNKAEKSKDARAFELFLQGKQSVEVAIELDMPADKVEELHVQYWRLSKLDNLEILYHEAEYSLSLLLQLFKILKDNRITKDKDIHDLIELANNGLPSLRNRHEDLLNQLTGLEKKKVVLGREILGLKSSIYTNNEIINRQIEQSRKLDRKLNQLHILLMNAGEDSNYHKVIEIIDQRLIEKKPLLVAALIAVMETLKKNPYGLNLLNSSSADIEDYLTKDMDGNRLLKFAESCYNNLLKSYVKNIA
jgi:arsenate reductase-like glutaredoxin family protein